MFDLSDFYAAKCPDVEELGVALDVMLLRRRCHCNAGNDADIKCDASYVT